MILITGDPGIGKTRLAEKAAEYAQKQNMRTIWGRSWEGGGAPAFWPWLSIVTVLAETGQREARGGLKSYVTKSVEIPSLFSRLGLDLASTDSDQDRFRLFAKITALIAKAAVDGPPLLLLIEDLHWADQSSILLFQFLTKELADIPICILATFRDIRCHKGTASSQILAALHRYRHATLIPLVGLTRSEVCEWLTENGGVEPSQRLVASIMDRTDGNPLFLSEVVPLLEEANRSSFDGKDTSRVVPLTIKEAIRTNFCAVSKECAAILEIASVIGRKFTVCLLAEVAGKSQSQICDILDEAIYQHIVDEPQMLSFRFHHDLVREAIYESLAPSARAKMHLLAARAIEKTDSCENVSRLSALAHHFVMSLPYGDAGGAFEYAMRAGQESRRLLAYEEAVSHFQQALEIGSTLGRCQCDILLSLGESQLRAGLWEESRQTFHQAAADARQNSNWTSFAQAAIGFKGVVAQIDSSAVALLREALGRLDDSSDSELRVRVLSALTHALYFGDAEQEMDACSRKAVEIAEQLGNPGLKLCAMESRLVSLGRPHCVDERLRVASQYLEIAKGTGDNESEFKARFIRHAALLEIGQPLEANEDLGCAEVLGRQGKDSRCQWQIALARSARALSAGDFSESLALTNMARDVGRTIHDSSPEHYFVVQRFQCERAQGSLSELRGTISKAVDRYPTVVGYRVAQAAICCSEGERAEAQVLLTCLAATNFDVIRRDALFLWTFGVLAEALEQCEQREWCERAYEVLLPFRAHNVVMSWGVAFDGSVEHFLGMLSGAIGELGRGVEHFEAALAMNAKMGAVPLVARTQERYAALLGKRDGSGDRERARELLEQAMQTMERIGMVGHLARARRTLEQLDERWTRARQCPQAVGEAVAVQSDGFVDPAAPRYLFRREGDYWSVAFDGVMVRLRHRRGLALLAVLLQRPETDVHVIDLVSAVDGSPADGAPSRERRPRKLLAALGRDAGPLADGPARNAYRHRLEELRAELADADGCNDLGRAALLQREIDQLADALRHVYGRGHRVRVAASACERARVNVRNNITYALGALKPSNAGLWRHMKSAVRTGTFCSYQPDRAIPWSF